MLSARKLSGALKRVRLVPVTGRWCRVVNAETLYKFQSATPYTPRPLYDLGPAREGARFTPKGGARALYLAEDVETAIREYHQKTVPNRVVPRAPAFVTFSATLKLERVLDLTDPAVLTALDTTAVELREPWRNRRDGRTPPTHVLGKAVAHVPRIQALRFASSKGPGACLVIFTATLRPPAFVRVQDPSSGLVAKLP